MAAAQGPSRLRRGRVRLASVSATPRCRGVISSTTNPSAMSVTGSTTPETDRSGCGREPAAPNPSGVEPFVERTAVNRGGWRPLEGLVVQLKCLVRARSCAGSGPRNMSVGRTRLADYMFLTSPRHSGRHGSEGGRASQHAAWHYSNGTGSPQMGDRPTTQTLRPRTLRQELFQRLLVLQGKRGHQARGGRPVHRHLRLARSSAVPRTQQVGTRLRLQSADRG